MITTVDNVLSLWISSDTPPEADVIQAWLGQIEFKIKAEYPAVMLAAVEDDEDAVQKVRYVATQVALRVLRNPDGVKSVMGLAGPFQEQTVYGGESQSKSLEFTPAERTILGGVKRIAMLSMIPERRPRTSPFDLLEGAIGNLPESD